MTKEQSNKLWLVSWRATGFGNSEDLYILANTPAAACAKATKYLREGGYVRPSIQGVSFQGEIDVF